MQKIDKKRKIKEISCSELLEVISMDAYVKLVDVRDPSYYENEHIKGAISMPLKEVRKRAKEFLEKEDTIITYCAGFKCPASTIATKILLSLGYKNVLDYKGGLETYKRAGLPLEGYLYVAK